MSERRVVIIGAGFGGLGMAVRLQQRGYDDIVILEKAEGIGGTWRDNTYPGAACDVPSHLYSFSFHPGVWRRKYSAQPEILAYLEDIARTYGLERCLRLGTEVRSLDWDEQRDRWHVTLGDGEVLEADAVVAATGQLNRPFVPDFPGRDDFAGESWHSARWRHDVDLRGKRVAVVGTGASAIQFVPEIAPTAEHVTVFQRSAPYLLPRQDQPYPARVRRRQARLPWLARLARSSQYLRLELITHAFTSSERLTRGLYKLWRQQLEQQVPDPELRRLLTPDYPLGCKRVLVSDDWYPTLMRDDVSLVPRPVASVTRDAVVDEAGVEHPCDVIIYGTGFRSLEFLVPMQVTGRDGRDLHERWREGAEAYRGTTVAGFPNLFVLYGPNTNLGSNSILYMLESQFAYVLSQLETLDREGLAWADVTDEAQARFNAEVQEQSRSTVFEADCHSWYTTADGRNTNNWPGQTFRFRQLTSEIDLSDHVVMPRRRPLEGDEAGTPGVRA